MCTAVLSLLQRERERPLRCPQRTRLKRRVVDPRDPHRTRHSAQPDTVQPPVQPLSTHRDKTYRFPQYMFSLPPQRTQHIPHGLLLFGFFSHGIGPEGLRHTGCPFASSDRAPKSTCLPLPLPPGGRCTPPPCRTRARTRPLSRTVGRKPSPGSGSGLGAAGLFQH